MNQKPFQQNLLSRGVGKAVSALLHASFAVLLIRVFPPAEYGGYAFAVSFATLFTIIADLGLHLLASREIAKGRHDRAVLLGTLTLLKIGLVWMAWLAMAAGCRWVIGSASGLWPLVAVTGGLVLADSAMEACQAVCHGFERMELSSIFGVVYRVATVGTGLSVIAWGGSLVEMVGGMAVAAWIVVAVAFMSLRRFLQSFRWRWDASLARELVSQGWPLAVSGLFTALYFRLDTVFLGIFHSKEVVGWYGAAYKLYELTMALPVVVASVLLPVVARSSSADATRVIKRTGAWLMACGGLVAAVGVTLAPAMMKMIGKGDYAPSIPLLQVLSVAVPFMFLHHVMGAALIGVGAQRSLAWLTAGCAMASIAAYALWIPEGGAMAAARITLVTDAVLAVGSAYLCWRLVTDRGAAP